VGTTQAPIWLCPVALPPFVRSFPSLRLTLRRVRGLLAWPAPADVAQLLCALAAASMRCGTGTAGAHARRLQTDIACTEPELSCFDCCGRSKGISREHPTPDPMPRSRIAYRYRYARRMSVRPVNKTMPRAHLTGSCVQNTVSSLLVCPDSDLPWRSWSSHPHSTVTGGTGRVRKSLTG
jgi:hypothetical protein